MPAATYDPTQGFAEVIRIDALGRRTWSVTASTFSNDVEPGAEVTLTFNTSSTGTPPGAANTIQVQARLPGLSTVIGSTTWSPTADGQTRTIHMDDNPLNSLLGTNRCGMFELYLRVIRTDLGTYDVDSRGNGADGDDEWCRGFMRAPLRVTGHSVSNVGIAGAEPALFAYPDPIYVRTTLQAQAWSTDTYTLALRQAGTQVAFETESSAGPNLDFEQDSDTDRVDAEYAVGGVDLRLTLDSDVMSGNRGSFREYVWAGTGHEASWVRNSDAELEYPNRFNVDPTVVLANEVLDLPGTTVFNRGEVQGGTFEVHNARAEAITPVLADSVRVRRVADGVLEDTAVVSRAAGVVSWDVTFGASGNVAPADATGDAKIVEWRDTSGGITLAWPLSAQVGLLSSLLDVEGHLQLNDSALDPTLHQPQRLTADLGFYSVLITNQRGQGKDGVTVTDHLRDDQDLVDQIDRTAVTATVNGHPGYLPLKAWDSALPGGGWDHWTDAGTFEGNTFEKVRQGVNASDYTLLSINPNLIVVTGGGHDTPGEDGLHWTSGNELLVGATVFNIGDRITVAADNSQVLDPGGQPYPRAYMTLARFNNATGTAQFYDSDGAWKNVEDNLGTVYQWQLLSIRRSNELQAIGSVGDERTYVYKFSEADTASWGLADLFFVPIIYVNSTPYSIWGITGVTGESNNHHGYNVDPVALGLHGVLGTR